MSEDQGRLRATARNYRISPNIEPRLPHVIMRFFTVPRVKDARSTAGWALVFIALLYTVAPAVGAMARMNLMDTIQPAPGQWLEVEQRPQWFKNWEKTGLLKFEDKNGDGKIQYVAARSSMSPTRRRTRW